MDPIGSVRDAVAVVEPTLRTEDIIAAIEAVAGNRSSQRRLARALDENPSLLTSGTTDGSPMVDDLIRCLRNLGARELVQPLCAGCGKPQRRMTTRDDKGLRICVTCANRRCGRFAPQPCTNCGKTIAPRFRDRNGGPRCEWCPPEPDIDHVEVISDALIRAGLVADRAALRQIILECVRQPARRRQLAWDLEDHPALLTGQANAGSGTVRRLVRTLHERGFDIEAPRCPFCGHSRRLESLRDGQPCCHSCYQDTRRTPCTRCARVLPIAARTVNGEPLCWACTQQAEFNHETCSLCGEFKPIATRRGGHPTCYDCRTMPHAQCSICGRMRPSHFPDSPAPRCIYCARRARAVVCSQCGEVQPPNTRDADGHPLCQNCSRRQEHCGLCGRFMPVTARIGSEARCWNCVKKEPALFRNCIDCNTFGRMRQNGRCDDCAAHHVLTRILSDETGAIPLHLHPVHQALAASPGDSLFTWLKGKNAKRLLAQLATFPGPIDHAAMDELEPARVARWLRCALVAQGVLPPRDEHLHAVERWLGTKLADLTDPAERRLVSRYVTWSHLRRLRASKALTTPGQTASIRTEVTSIVKLIAWLKDRGIDLSECTQADLDQWCLQGGRMPLRSRSFVAWCAQRRHLPPMAIPAPPARQDRHLLDDDHRWAKARHLLHSETVDTVDRTAGLLVLLYGQSAHRIVKLTINDVVDTPQQMQLHLGTSPVSLPDTMADLVRELVDRRRGKAAVGHTDAHDWLFPGGDPGQPLHPQSLSVRLRRIGVSVRDGRNAALMDMASTMPAKVISDLLGISVGAAAHWSTFAGSSNADYAASVVRRRSQL